MTINQLIQSASVNTLDEPRYAYAAPTYKEAESIAWTYLRHYTEPIPGVKFNEQKLRATLPNGARLQLLGTENYDSLRGPYLDGIVLDEYAYTNPEAWKSVIRPQLVDRKGFAIFIGTPLGRNHFFDVYEKARQRPGALTAMYRASETGIIDPEELAEAKADMGEDYYAQEFECSFEAAIQGAYYARQIEEARAAGRITTVGWQRELPVDTWWDLGFTDATAIIFTQRAGKQLHLIDYLEANKRELAYYAKELQRRPYLYQRHYLPHDATGTELGQGRTLDQQLNALNVKPTRIVDKIDVLDGINAARTLFARCWFDADKCAPLITALTSYRSAWDAKLNTFKREPLHDWSSNGADAFRYMAVGLRGPEQHPGWEGSYRKPTTRSTYNILDHGRERRAASTSRLAW